MPLYMYQAAYTPESWAAQIKNPQNRVETVGRQACEAVGGKLVGGWLCFGEYDLVIIADVPNNESMAALALAVGAGGAIKASKTTVLMTGTEGVGPWRRRTPSPRSIAPLDSQSRFGRVANAPGRPSGCCGNRAGTRLSCRSSALAGFQTETRPEIWLISPNRG